MFRLNKRNKISDYTAEELVSHITFKNREYRKRLKLHQEIDGGVTNSLLAVSLALMKSNIPHVSVIDLGGGGAHLHASLRILYPEIQFNFIVIETAEMVRQNLNNHESGLSFTTLSNFLSSEPYKYDVLIANSCLQYLDEPLTNLLQVIKHSHVNFMYIGKTPFHDGSGYINGIQTSLLTSNGPKVNTSSAKTIVSYGAKILPLLEFYEILKCDWQIVFQLVEGTFQLKTPIFRKPHNYPARSILLKR